MRSPRFLSLLTVVALVAVLAVQVDAQQGRGQGGRGRGGPGGFQGRGFGGGGKLGLLRIDAVKKELELLDEQSADIEKLGEELRAQANSGRPDFRNLSDEERQKLREEYEALSDAEKNKREEERQAQQQAQQKQADAKLAEILLPHQMDRLNQIALQVQGPRALASDEVAKELGLSDSAKADIAAALEASREKFRAEMQALFQRGNQGGNQGGFGEKMREFNKALEKEALAKLTESQRDKFAEMKGEPFEMPQGGFGGGQRRRGGNGNRGGDGGGRPQRPPTE